MDHIWFHNWIQYKELKELYNVLMHLWSWRSIANPIQRIESTSSPWITFDFIIESNTKNWKTRSNDKSSVWSEEGIQYKELKVSSKYFFSSSAFINWIQYKELKGWLLWSKGENSIVESNTKNWKPQVVGVYDRYVRSVESNTKNWKITTFSS